MAHDVRLAVGKITIPTENLSRKRFYDPLRKTEDAAQ